VKQVQISIHCPQCGGNISFLEEAHVVRCQFCGSSLLVGGREGVLRFVLPPQMTNAHKVRLQALEYMLSLGKLSPRAGDPFLFYAPFWRMQGIVYRWVFCLKPMKVEIEAGVPPPVERMKVLLTRLMDQTIPGYENLEIGLSSLGIRPQALLLKPFSREHLEQRGSFLPLEVSLEKAQAEAERFAHLFFQAEDLIPEVVLQRAVGIGFSIIYFPLWFVECHHEGGREVVLLDAVGQIPVQTIPDGSLILARLRGGESRKSFQFSELRFLPFRCPNCGWEFPFRPLSLLHFCPTCRHLFQEKKGEWAEMKYGVIPAAERGPAGNLLWMPFWRCKTVLESFAERLETMESLYRLAPPPRVLDRAREARRPIYFYIPAVKFRNPQTIHTLGSRLTFVQPEVKIGSFEDGSHPLTAGGSLSETDARQMGEVILGSMIPQGNRKARSWMKNCRVDLQDSEILYFPFRRVDLFWKEPTSGISFQHKALSEDLLPSHLEVSSRP
jgi:DNA-directed RNA polymerase subunit RPC12/RpoP